MIARGGPHWLELIPPLGAAVVYLALYAHRFRQLTGTHRAPTRWRASAFGAGIVLLVAVQVGPLDGLADQMLAVHMAQHIVIGDICSLLIVLGLSGPMLQPLLQVRATRPLRKLSHPLVAFALWAVDLYAWHVPLLYQLAIRHDLVHALEHACLLWFGALLWLALVGPLPKPRWFSGWGQVGYIALVRIVGSLLGNAMIWAQTVFYPIYRSTDSARGLNPVSDQNIAGGLMMVEQMLLTLLLLGLLFYRLAMRDEQRQELVDLAVSRGVELSDERARRAAAAGAADRLRARIEDHARG
ncbi:MAG: cytochrome c oxidase assembly protein [Solirubrobacteraceae bacterium]